jgi:hypothetical protein
MSPAQGSLSGEWEVPVTRNAEIDPGDNDPPPPPPKMTQGVMRGRKELA